MCELCNYEERSNEMGYDSDWAFTRDAPSPAPVRKLGAYIEGVRKELEVLDRREVEYVALQKKWQDLQAVLRALQVSATSVDVKNGEFRRLFKEAMEKIGAA
jgi:hypothetical protein